MHITTALAQARRESYLVKLAGHYQLYTYDDRHKKYWQHPSEPWQQAFAHLTTWRTARTLELLGIEPIDAYHLATMHDRGRLPDRVRAALRDYR